MNKREFLKYSGFGLGGLLLGRWFWQGMSECYAVECERIESTTRYLLDERPRRRKDEIRVPFSLGEIKESDSQERKEYYLGLLRRTLHSPNSVFTPADGAFGLPRDGTNLTESDLYVLDPAEVVRWGLILRDVFRGESRLSSADPLDCVEHLYYYFTQKIHEHKVKWGGMSGEEYRGKKRMASKVGNDFILSLWNQDNLGIFNDNHWVLAASWLPILGSCEGEIRIGSDFILTDWIEGRHAGLVNQA
jgi:hypothetical protein